MPQSLKKTGAPIENVENSQKKANPPHIRLKGISKKSARRIRMPHGGWPDHSRRSPDPSSREISVSGVSRSMSPTGRFPGHASHDTSSLGAAKATPMP